MKIVKSCLICTVIIVQFMLCINKSDCDEISLFQIAGHLYDDGYYIEANPLTPKDSIPMLLFFRDKSNYQRTYYAYAIIDSYGRFLQRPDSICALSFLPSMVGFDQKGAVYIYSNMGHGFSGPLIRFAYDPHSGKGEIKEFPEINQGCAICVTSIPELGNVILLKGRFKETPLSIVIDNIENNDITVVDLGDINPDIAIYGGAAIGKLSDSHIIIVGLAMTGPGAHGEYERSLLKLIYDYENNMILSIDNTASSKVISELQPSEYVLPSSDVGNIIKVNDRYFYMMCSGDTDRKSELLSNTLFVEIDSTGNFIPPDKASDLSIVESSFKTIPRNYALLRIYIPEIKAHGFWMLSLDEFPTITIDKGATKR